MSREAMENMTDDELLALNQTLMKDKEQIRQQQLEINQILTNRAAEAKAKRTAAGLSNTEKAALLQVIQPSGIESEESFER